MGVCVYRGIKWYINVHKVIVNLSEIYDISIIYTYIHTMSMYLEKRFQLVVDFF